MPKLSSSSALDTLREAKTRQRLQHETVIVLCSGTACSACGCLPVLNALTEELENKGLSDKVELRATGCHGFCEQGPLMVIQPGDVFYCRIAPEDVAEIVSETIEKKNIVDRLLYVEPKTGMRIEHETDIPFYKAQERSVLGRNKLVSPKEIGDYIAVGGYSSLARVLGSLDQDAVIEMVKSSGLRGRGGGGFPTGIKWQLCKDVEPTPKYIVCNADEGDPGAYMDRSLLEGNPHMVLEGMLIGAYAIGASEGFIYVRHEYPLAVEHTKIAIDQAREAGLLGEDIMGSGFGFDVKICKGAGAFVCGEETGLIAAIEGRVSEPVTRPPYPVERGLWGQPTLINNVETLANVPIVIDKGAEGYASVGTEGSKGTKIFSLVGKVNNTGLVEVPMGITLREIIFDIGGGIQNGKRFKAVQTGGPSGGCLPEGLLDLEVDFDELTKAGSMMGSGGMVVMNERTCMVDVAKYFLTFLQDESCGNCVPCRIGISRMLEIVTDISEGNGTMEQISLLEETAEATSLASLCGLGKTAANPPLSTLKYFREEYQAHIEEKRCPAGVCRALITYSIIEDKCDGCMLCKKACPTQAVSGEKKALHVIDQDKCDRCGICMDVCKQDAVAVV
ncbi:MAG: NADH-quinone oxidoreductase subunit F [Proteobacteria bacterium]|nr:NADH-quinone oxidoreductase subunit F [Pseudomonadota bacterium]